MLPGQTMDRPNLRWNGVEPGAFQPCSRRDRNSADNADREFASVFRVCIAIGYNSRGQIELTYLVDFKQRTPVHSLHPPFPVEEIRK
jgi:hypothetical protein